MNEKLETGAMLNPRCQECSKKDKCNNKTLCTYLIPPEEIKPEKALTDAIENALADVILTPEMIQKRAIEKKINESLGIGVDMGCGYSKQGGVK